MGMLTKALSSTGMEAECASYWRSIDAISDESEMIASLQSLLWSSSEVDLAPGLCSSSVPYSLPGSSPISTNDNEKNTLVSKGRTANVLGTPALAHGEKVVGSKRKAEMDEEKNHGGEGCTTPSAPRARKQSKANSQSCYAKMRRERINARLKILQELIPNGKKVDISTMLDEAVQYVKFLHMQIKLLSSDEMWMYAPLAYDSVNIGIPLHS